MLEKIKEELIFLQSEKIRYSSSIKHHKELQKKYPNKFNMGNSQNIALLKVLDELIAIQKQKLSEEEENTKLDSTDTLGYLYSLCKEFVYILDFGVETLQEVYDMGGDSLIRLDMFGKKRLLTIQTFLTTHGLHEIPQKSSIDKRSSIRKFYLGKYNDNIKSTLSTLGVKRFRDMYKNDIRKKLSPEEVTLINKALFIYGLPVIDGIEE